MILNERNSELLQTAALADREGYSQAARFLVETISKPEAAAPVPQPAPPVGFISHSRLVEAIGIVHRSVHKIEAIKVYRALTGAGLKESKDWVETYVTPRVIY